MYPEIVYECTKQIDQVFLSLFSLLLLLLNFHFANSILGALITSDLVSRV